ncbi:fimbrial protein [Stenotrophomonas sp. Iso1]|uniref:fimbrial protein n=1 Tax=Stenotrophomonas sp. Iso1 TaxID=2977283 RepID=UPI0022B7903B|nr:fimbrial protein [Stenotrophomonas sp. Iso1]
MNLPPRRICLAVVAVLGCVAAPSALANCVLRSNTFVPQDVQMDMGQVVILPGTPIGGVIKELRVAINQRSSVANCTGGGSAMGRYVNAAQQIPVPGFANVFATDVAGVGIRVYRDSGQIQAYYPHTLLLSNTSLVDLAGGTFRVELIKTAAQTGSGVIAPNGRFTTYYYDGNGSRFPVLTSTFKGSGTTVVNASCQVQAGSRNIVVDFGSVPNTTFNGVGSRAVDRDFDIQLTCQGSNLPQYQSPVSIRLDATQDSSNRPGVLALAAGGNRATRIGIEVVQREGAVESQLRFGEAVPIGRTVVGSNTLTLPLRARYIQTVAGTVGPGTASGSATFTIEYK